MKQIVVCLLAILAITTTTVQPESRDGYKLYEAQGGGFMWIPLPWRQQNWVKNGSGSCVHAGTVMALRYADLFDDAEWWRQNHGAGEYPERLSRRLSERNIKHVLHLNGEEEFLQDCSNTNRPAVIGYGNSHSQLFCGFEDGYALILDNNNIRNPYKVEKSRFIQLWRGWGGWAVVPLGEPATPPNIYYGDYGEDKNFN